MIRVTACFLRLVKFYPRQIRNLDKICIMNHHSMETDPTSPDIEDQLLEAQLPHDVSGISVFCYADGNFALRHLNEHHAGYIVETQYFISQNVAEKLLSMGVPIANLQCSRLPPR